MRARVESEEKNARKLLKKCEAEKEEEFKRVKHEEAIRKVRIKNRKNYHVDIIPEAVAVVLPKIRLPEVVFACNSKLLNKSGNQLDGQEKTTASLAETVSACNITEQGHSEGAHKELQGQAHNVEERSQLTQLARNLRSQLKLQNNRERGGFNRRTEEVLLLRQNNRALDQELKEAKDRLERQQAEYTNQRQDLSVQESEGRAENKEIIEAVREATDKTKNMVTLSREGLKKEEELARMKSFLSVKCEGLEGCKREMEEVNMRMSLEQEQSRQLRNELEKEEKERKEEVSKLEIKILMDQYRRLDSDMEQRKRENERRIQHLHSQMGQGHKVCNVLIISTVNCCVKLFS